MDARDLRFDCEGAELRASALSDADMVHLAALFAEGLADRPGARLFGVAALTALASGTLAGIASSHLGKPAVPIRALLFDKTPERNWAVAWHRDRTIAVRERRETPSFGPWSVKDGIPHVAPPFDVLAGMATLRAHLDDCGPENAPLLIAPGSHRVEAVGATDAAALASSHALPCLASAGDVWAYATPILHASEAARSPVHRRVLQVDYATDALPGELEWLGIA